VKYESDLKNSTKKNGKCDVSGFFVWMLDLVSMFSSVFFSCRAKATEIL